MKRQSNTVPVLVFGTGVVALIVALILAFVPFSTSGAAEPTAAFTAQKNLDEVAFQLGSAPGARYSGTLSMTSDGSAGTKTVEFTDLTVASTKNAEGSITFDSTGAQYRQIGNYRYVNGPSKLWRDLFAGASIASQIDFAATDNKWTNLRYSGLPDLGYLLSPALLAGRIGNTERVKEPELGLELPAPNKGLPDARFWPTSDPQVTAIGADKVQVGTMETTFDPSSKRVTHIKGEFAREGYRVTVDTAVDLLAPEDLTKLFANERSLVPELTNVPAPAVPLAGNAINTRASGNCTTAACEFTIAASGALAPEVVTEMRGATGHVNFGITVQFEVDGSRAGERGGTCTRVLTVPFGGRTQTTCSATNLPPGSRSVKTATNIQLLPFIEVTATDLTDYIDSQEKSSKQPVEMVRTGSKKAEAARYNDQVAGFPSSYGIKQGDYVFDGVGPEGNLFVAFGPGYAQHITTGRLDPSWSGTSMLTDQLKQQIAASGDREITYVTAEEELATALRLLAIGEGISSDKLKVFATAPDNS
ncbi:hypothetical protein [Gordonia insulae]|uniref:Uncharacterized protein n=1 Tax=Gordonia insulae TaxID=2420509 RepID=A0A3G8JL48_9ACTN|nr:hypothetical protein [Gordonia insulae]AZG45282.1 hypothetical protein D7316_01877 [Gordonia insulae]